MRPQYPHMWKMRWNSIYIFRQNVRIEYWYLTLFPRKARKLHFPMPIGALFFKFKEEVYSMRLEGNLLLFFNNSIHLFSLFVDKDDEELNLLSQIMKLYPRALFLGNLKLHINQTYWCYVCAVYPYIYNVETYPWIQKLS